ncbi:hypothetical protein JCM11491_000142 [Sporobolomyces phaffii]
MCSTFPGFRPGHHWEVERHRDRPRFSRRLGVLEQRFDIASRNGGQSDTFARLRLTLSGPEGGDSRTTLLARLLLAWTHVRAKHPLLGASIEDDAGHAVSQCPARRFRYEPPSQADALARARDSFLVARAERLDARMDEIQNESILNGERNLLDESSCLARLVFIESAESPDDLGFFLVISHVISDGLSVFKLIAELFSIASDPACPTPSLPFDLCDFDDFINRCSAPSAALTMADRFHEAWRTTLPENEILTALPLATEDHYPPLPLVASPPHVHQQPVEVPSPQVFVASDRENSAPITTARKRWVWAIARTLILARQRRFPHSLHVPRLSPTPPPSTPKSRWEFLRFDRTTSSKLFQFSKRNGQSPSMLLYSMLSLATAKLFATCHPSEPYHPILVGFPFSARRFLERGPTPSSDPATDLAIRITFGSIHLPNVPLRLDDGDSNTVRAAVVRSARLAKRQFDHRLAADELSRTLFLAVADGLNIDRLLLRHGIERPPWEDPKTCINASMIGDVDRILPARYNIDGIDLRLSDLQLGTRLHLGEGNFNEGFTFDGKLQLSMGVDDQVIDPRHVRTILETVERIGNLVAEGEHD